MGYENNTKRIRTDVNVNDKHLRVKLDQNYDRLKILSLTLNQNEIYNNPSADFGVVVGRVVSSGIGIPNARVSIFIPIDESDQLNQEIFQRYPYEKPEDTNSQGKKYNLLPKLRRWVRGLVDPVLEWKPNRFGVGLTPPTPIGSFPDKVELINGTEEGKTYREIYKKYYKYTTVTNDSGDYMIYGVPTGSQTIHVDVDLTDIGPYSISPTSLKNDGYSENFYEDGRIKTYNELDKNPHYKSQTFSINVRPFWGDKENQEIGITRQDFNLNANITPTFTLFGNTFTMSEGDFWGDRVVFRIWIDWPLAFSLYVLPESKRILRKQFNFLKRGGILCFHICKPRIRFQLWNDTNMSRLSGGFDESNPFALRISPPKVGRFKTLQPDACGNPCDPDDGGDVKGCGKCDDEISADDVVAATANENISDAFTDVNIDCNDKREQFNPLPIVPLVTDEWDPNATYSTGNVVKITESNPTEPLGYGIQNGNPFIAPIIQLSPSAYTYDLSAAESATLGTVLGQPQWSPNGTPIDLSCKCEEPDISYFIKGKTYDGYIAQREELVFFYQTGSSQSATAQTSVTLNAEPDSWQAEFDEITNPNGTGPYAIPPDHPRTKVEVNNQVLGYFSGEDFWAQETITIPSYSVDCNDYIQDAEEEALDEELSLESDKDFNQQLRPENFRNLTTNIEVITKTDNLDVNDPDFNAQSQFELLSPDRYEFYNDKPGLFILRMPCNKVKKATDEFGNLVDVGDDEEGVFTEFDGYFIFSLEGETGTGPKKTRVRRPVLKVPSTKLSLSATTFFADSGSIEYKYPSYNYDELKSEWANFKFGRLYSVAMRLGVEPTTNNGLNYPTTSQLDYITERGLERYTYFNSQFTDSTLDPELRKGYYYDAQNRYNDSDVTGDKGREIEPTKRFKPPFEPFASCYWEKPGAIDLMYDGSKDGFEGFAGTYYNNNVQLFQPCNQYFFYNDWINFSLFFPNFAIFKKVRRDRYSPYIVGLPLQRPRRTKQGAYAGLLGQYQNEGVKDINGNDFSAGPRHAKIDIAAARRSDDTYNVEYLINHDFFPTAIVEVPKNDIVNMLDFTLREELVNGKLDFITQRKGFVIAVNQNANDHQLYHFDINAPSNAHIISGSSLTSVNQNALGENSVGSFNNDSLIRSGFYKYESNHVYKDFDYDMTQNKPAFVYMGLKENHALLYLIEKGVI